MGVFRDPAVPFFVGEYLELVPYERIRYTDKFDDPNLPGLMQVTITFKKVFCGTSVLQIVPWTSPGFVDT